MSLSRRVSLEAKLKWDTGSSIDKNKRGRGVSGGKRQTSVSFLSGATRHATTEVLIENPAGTAGSELVDVQSGKIRLKDVLAVAT